MLRLSSFSSLLIDESLANWGVVLKHIFPIISWAEIVLMPAAN